VFYKQYLAVIFPG